MPPPQRPPPPLESDPQRYGQPLAPQTMSNVMLYPICCPFGQMHLIMVRPKSIGAGPSMSQRVLQVAEKTVLMMGQCRRR